MDSWLGKRVTIVCEEPSEDQIGVFHRVNHIEDRDDSVINPGLTHEEVIGLTNRKESLD